MGRTPIKDAPNSTPTAVNGGSSETGSAPATSLTSGWATKRSARTFPHLPVHPPIPPGPGDRLYETGRFPWQRG